MYCDSCFIKTKAFKAYRKEKMIKSDYFRDLEKQGFKKKYPTPGFILSVIFFLTYTLKHNAS